MPSVFLRVSRSNHRLRPRLVPQLAGLVIAAASLGGQPAKDRALGPSTWSAAADRLRGSSEQMLEDSRFRTAIAQEGPYARLNRVAQDYAYAIHDRPNDPALLQRLLADNLKPVESFTAGDGTAAAVFQDLKTGRHIITFRGTTTGNDWYRNAVESGRGGQSVGTLSYATHHAVFDRWVDKYGADGGLTVTGHSRGGTMAQELESYHGDKVSLTATYQSPGVDAATRQRFEKIPYEKRGANVLFAATNDAVADVGGDHLGNPQVYLFSGKDMDWPGRFFGHTSFASQPEGLLDSQGNAYRDPKDGRSIAAMSYADYKTQVRGSALLDYANVAGKAIDWFLGVGGQTSVEGGGTAAKATSAQVAEFMKRNGKRPENSDWKQLERELAAAAPASPVAPKLVPKLAPGPAPGSAPTRPSSGPTARLRLSIVDAVSGQPLQSATVVRDGENTAVFGGMIELTLPAGVDNAMQIEADGYETHKIHGKQRAGSSTDFAVKMKPSAASAPLPSPPPAAAPVGSYAGSIMKRDPGNPTSGKTYRGLTLRVDGDRITGKMIADKDQDIVLDWTFSGNYRNFVMKGETTSQRKLAGEIRGTVTGVYLVDGTFLVNEMTPTSMRGTWNVRFQRTGEKWSGPFEVSR
jgi:hypothetical protein